MRRGVMSGSRSQSGFLVARQRLMTIHRHHRISLSGIMEKSLAHSGPFRLSELTERPGPFLRPATGVSTEPCEGCGPKLGAEPGEGMYRL